MTKYSICTCWVTLRLFIANSTLRASGYLPSHIQRALFAGFHKRRFARRYDVPISQLGKYNQ